MSPENHGACFHCGLPVPAGGNYQVIIDGIARDMCCYGCKAVAEAIVDSGLTDFYHHRTVRSGTVDTLIPEQLREMELYDREDVQRTFVHSTDVNAREASLILEGIVCAACVWLNERHVGNLPGVLEFHVNYATRRSRVIWDPRAIRLSEILKAIAAIGYSAHPFDPTRQELLQREERSKALRRLVVAGIGAVQVMMLAVALYLGDYSGMDSGLRELLRWTSLVITLPIVAYSGQPFFVAALRDLRSRRLGMDVPVSLAIALAFVASVWATFGGAGEIYFDSVTMFIFFLLGGRFLEMSARHKSGQATEQLVKLLPALATLVVDSSERAVAVADLALHDRVRIRPGEPIPADGRIVLGESSVDESLLSGESAPIRKVVGDTVVAGATNLESPLEVAVDRVGRDTVLSSIVRLLERAQSERPQIAATADRIAGWFVVGVLLLAAAVGAWWLLHSPQQALPVVLSLLVVTCPCALSLATPAALTVATGELTRSGLLVTRGQALETLARATHIIFDKTGTLTFGRLQVGAVKVFADLSEQRVLAIAAALEQGSEHPIGRALSTCADTKPLAVTGIRNVPGQGVTGEVDGQRYRLGRKDFVRGQGKVGGDISVDSETTVFLADERELVAVFVLTDTLRPEAPAVLTGLRSEGLHIVLLSGDDPGVIKTLAVPLAIESAEGGLLPADKLQRVKSLQDRGAVVAMVGDGINDGPVLAGAQVSVAMGSGTGVAQNAADMILLSENLEALLRGVRGARATLRVIRQNLYWALTYNALALPLAAAGWIKPWMAAIGMSASSLVVVLNALRLKDKH